MKGGEKVLQYPATIVAEVAQQPRTDQGVEKAGYEFLPLGTVAAESGGQREIRLLVQKMITNLQSAWYLWPLFIDRAIVELGLSSRRGRADSPDWSFSVRSVRGLRLWRHINQDKSKDPEEDAQVISWSHEPVFKQSVY